MDYPKQHHRVLFSDPEYAQKTIKDNMKTIKEIREKAGLSQREFGKRIGKTGSYISQAEAGKIALSRDAMEKIYSAFSGMHTEGSVADRLKLARKAREYTQGELAGLISCSRNTLSAAENGKSVLSARLLHAVSEKLWISEDWLRFGVGGMERSEKIAEVLEAIQSDPNVRNAVLIFLKKEMKNQDG